MVPNDVTLLVCKRMHLLAYYKNKRTRMIVTCKNGHQWNVFWPNYQRAKECPHCTGKAVKTTLQEVKNFASSLGYTLLTDLVSVLELKCPEGHLWKTTWDKFKNRRYRCPECRKEKTKNAILIRAKELSYTLIELSNFKKIHLRCNMEHIWVTNAYDFIKGHTCYHCHYKKWEPSEIGKALLDRGYKLKSEYKTLDAPLLLECLNNHKWETTWYRFQYIGCECPHCNKNKPEEEISTFLSSWSIPFIHRDKKQIGLELDFYLPDYSLAIEYCGLYWHSEAQLDKNYHLNKLKRCQEKKIKLLTIFEDEWLEKKEIIFSKILGILGKHRKIFARKCDLKEIDLKTSKGFLNLNHLQGYSKSVRAWGLYYKQEIVSVITLGKHHRQGKYPWVLNRFCNKMNTSVVGGASRLLKATNQYRPLISWADLRLSEGNVYKKLGFELDGILPPDYSYVKNKKRFSKQSLKKTKEERLLGKTEHQLRLEQGYLRVWDCGKQRWALL